MGKRLNLDLVGKEFGRWTVLAKAEKRKRGIYWTCQCSCGTIKDVITNSLVNGISTSCGCYAKEVLSKRRRSNLVGKRFGRLLVLEAVGQDKKKQVLYLCLCDCGKKIILVGGYLTRTRRPTRSCGCLAKDRSSEAHSKNLIRQTFGRLTVIERAGSRRGKALWHCSCLCGGNTYVISSNLLNGNIKSCGCLIKENMQRIGKQCALPKGEAAFNSLYCSYRGIAKKKGIEFILTKEQFHKLTTDNCFYCNRSPQNVQKNPSGNGNYIYNGVDKIDPHGNYEEHNVLTACSICNHAKNNLSLEDFLSWLTRITGNIDNLKAKLKEKGFQIPEQPPAHEIEYHI